MSVSMRPTVILPLMRIKMMMMMVMFLLERQSISEVVIINDGADGDDDGDEDDNGDDDDNDNQGSVSQVVVGAKSQGRLIRLHPHCQLGQTREDAPLSSSSLSFVIVII